MNVVADRLGNGDSVSDVKVHETRSRQPLARRPTGRRSWSRKRDGWSSDRDCGRLQRLSQEFRCDLRMSRRHRSKHIAVQGRSTRSHAGLGE